MRRLSKFFFVLCVIVASNLHAQSEPARLSKAFLDTFSGRIFGSEVVLNFGSLKAALIRARGYVQSSEPASLPHFDQLNALSEDLMRAMKDTNRDLFKNRNDEVNNAQKIVNVFANVKAKAIALSDADKGALTKSFAKELTRVVDKAFTEFKNEMRRNSFKVVVADALPRAGAEEGPPLKPLIDNMSPKPWDLKNALDTNKTLQGKGAAAQLKPNFVKAAANLQNYYDRLAQLGKKTLNTPADKSDLEAVDNIIQCTEVIQKSALANTDSFKLGFAKSIKAIASSILGAAQTAMKFYCGDLCSNGNYCKPKAKDVCPQQRRSSC